MEIELFSPAFWSALLSIIIIDLVLAGDNAVVIGMAARNLPKELQMRAILWGTAGAIGIRIFATIIVVWLLKIPGLLLIGGILLIWIAYKLLVEKKDHEIKAEPNIWAAIRTIVIADAVMGVDNVIAIAGAAHGDIVLVIIGLLVSVPIIVWGSTLIISWIERYPVIIYIGAAVLAYTAAKMIVGEPWIKDFFIEKPLFKWTLVLIITAGVILAGVLKNRAHRKAAQS
jgi:YjbE family integral membrane protein